LSKRIIKSSKQRDLILRILRSTKSHPTADWVYDQARKEMPKISKATVYRNLNLLKEEGKIRECTICKGIIRYDGDVRLHYHIRCIECGRIDDVPIVTSVVCTEEVAKLSGYIVLSHHLDFTGICSKCQEKEKERINKKSGAGRD